MSNAGRTRLGCAVAGLVALSVIGLGVWGVVRRNSRRAIEVYVYLGESTQGLSAGSAVRLRGIVVGEVREIGIASDGRLIEVKSSLWWDELVELGLIDPKQPFGPEHGPFAPPGFYAYLAQVGFTDLRVIELDFHPADRVLEFPAPPDAPWARIPAAQSTPQAIKEFVETRFSGSGQALLAGIEAITELEARTQDVDGKAVNAQIMNRIDDLQAMFEGPPLGAQARKSLTTGMEGLQELEATVADVRSALAAKRPTQASTNVDDLIDRLETAQAQARGLELRKGLNDQRLAAAELEQRVREVHAALSDVRRWLTEFGDGVEGQADDRDGLLVSPAPAER